MSRNRQTWLVLLLAPLYAVVVKLAEDQGYISAGYNVVTYIALAVLLIFLVMQGRRGRLAMPSGFRMLRTRGLVLFGLSLVLASFTWLLGGIILFGGNASYGTLIPFFVLLLSGLMIAGGGLWFKFLRLMMGGK